jgi:hypothetical protein
MLFSQGLFGRVADGGGRRWGWPADGVEVRDDLLFFIFPFSRIFMLTCQWVPVHLNKLCHIRAEKWVPHVSFRVNSASIRNQCTLLAICWILVVFYDSNVKLWFSEIYPSISWFYANYSPGICTWSPVNFDRVRPLITKYDGLMMTKFYFSFSFLLLLPPMKKSVQWFNIT